MHPQTESSEDACACSICLHSLHYNCGQTPCASYAASSDGEDLDKHGRTLTHEYQRVHLGCGHSFHCSCLEKWVNANGQMVSLSGHYDDNYLYSEHAPAASPDHHNTSEDDSPRAISQTLDAAGTLMLSPAHPPPSPAAFTHGQPQKEESSPSQESPSLAANVDIRRKRAQAADAGRRQTCAILVTCPLCRAVFDGLPLTLTESKKEVKCNLSSRFDDASMTSP